MIGQIVNFTNEINPIQFLNEQFNNQHIEKVFAKGEYVYTPQQAANKIYFIMEGRVKISTFNNAGKEITKSILSPGEIFGELSLANEKTRHNFAIALDKVKLAILSKEQADRMMKHNHNIYDMMMKRMGSRIMELENRLESLLFKDSRSRVIDFLTNLTIKKGRRVGFEREVRDFLTHKEIANLTETSRQTVTTVLNELRNKNILTFNRRRLLVRDLDALRAEIGQRSNYRVKNW